MSATTTHFDPALATAELRAARAVTRPLMRLVIEHACRRCHANPQSQSASHLRHLIDAEAWADAALALLAGELPQWQVRRLVYDGGEWHCALSRKRDMPDWLDDSVEAHHADLATALLLAFTEAQASTVMIARASVPTVVPPAPQLYQPLACDNVG